MRLLACTRAQAERCALDPRGDLGLGEVHFPEFELARGPSVLGSRDDGRSADADTLLRLRCEQAIGGRYGSTDDTPKFVNGVQLPVDGGCSASNGQPPIGELL